MEGDLDGAVAACGTMAKAADLEVAALRWGLPLLDVDDLGKHL
ncbi:hypothetical protein ABGB18_05575 [Nonomuraea sp. B12E4]